MSNPNGSQDPNQPWQVYGSNATAGNGAANPTNTANSANFDVPAGMPTENATPFDGGIPRSTAQGAAPGAAPYGTGAPYGTPTEYSGATPGADTPFGQFQNYQELPSRAGSIWTLVIGLVLMIIVPLVTLFAFVVNAATGIVDSDKTVYLSNGDTFELDRTESLVVVQMSGSSLESCEFVNESGSSYSITYDDSFSAYYTHNLSAGTYTLECVSNPGSIAVMTEDNVADTGFAVVKGLLIAVGLGLVGLIVTIVGIVKLVLVNGRIRNAKLRSQMYYGQGGGYGSAPGGGGDFPGNPGYGATPYSN